MLISKLPDKETLHRLYWDDWLTMDEIGKRYGVGVSCVSGRMIKLGIPRRRFKHGCDPIPEDDLRKLYCQHKQSIARIAALYGSSLSYVSRRLRQIGIEPRDPKARAKKGIDHPRYKGDGWITAGGYKVVSKPDGGSGYEHRLVMQKHLGRALLRGEHVHHKNGDKLDNRPENLEVLSAASHFKISRDGAIKTYLALKSENKTLRATINKLTARIHRLNGRIEILKSKHL